MVSFGRWWYASRKHRFILGGQRHYTDKGAEERFWIAYSWGVELQAAFLCDSVVDGLGTRCLAPSEFAFTAVLYQFLDDNVVHDSS